MRQSHAMQLCLGPEQLGVQRSRGVTRPLEGCQLYSWKMSFKRLIGRLLRTCTKDVTYPLQASRPELVNYVVGRR